eukprot:TRINITY_DN8592_c0_g1_i2.p1 TRINITY_DN8592_c0_g1~~TRINITY_DN8592_c0_g1_i2.p1  ORF type:complete len:367 (+),score=141.72 TRINITY_DN8592_c0_g1_i2:45-1103(+)
MANQEWVIRRRPGSEELAEGHFELRPCSVPVLADGELLVRMELFSVDPTMRNFIAGGDVAMTAQRDVAYYKNSDAWQVGSPPVGAAVGRVVESRARAGPRVGALVRVRGPWRLFNAVRAPLAEELDDSIAPEDHLGVLGTGLAAYLPCVHIGEVKRGETAFVSGGAGAVGLAAVQVLQLLGCSVVASAGSDAKVQLLRDLGAKAFNYKKQRTLAALQQLAPKGIDIYFDNVGGEALEDSIEVMRDFGRIIACGQISQYNLPPQRRYGVRNLFHITAKRIRFQGYIIDTHSFTPQQFADGRRQMAEWLRSGRFKSRHTVLDGFAQLPRALCGLFTGANTGKMMVRVSAGRAGL